jgi:hypothetical protein
MSTALSNAPVVKTEVIAYRYDLDDSEQRIAYSQLQEQMANKGIKLMRVYSMDNSKESVESGFVSLDTSHLFGDQWNTTDDSESNPKRRIFNWYESIVPNKVIRYGHYTMVTDEMRQLQEDVLKCGFCGNHEWASKAGHFCDQCIGSSYLSADEVDLLLMVPVSKSFGANRKELIETGQIGSTEEFEHVMAEYRAAQLRQSEIASEKARNEVEQRYQNGLAKITAERDGFLWLLDHGINVDNCIYYSHAKTFCFGWRNSLDKTARADLEQALEGFPFKFEFK